MSQTRASATSTGKSPPIYPVGLAGVGLSGVHLPTAAQRSGSRRSPEAGPLDLIAEAQD
jgi:hypothetical protein